MRRSRIKLALTLALAAAALAVVGVGPAAAHGGPRGGGVSTSALVNAAAKQLDVTSAKLKAAILDSAVKRIDDAVDDGDLSKADAADLKDEAQDNLNVAYALSQTRTVASSLGITSDKLNTAFRAARKALLLAKIDAAVDDGTLSTSDAADLKARLDKATLPGYKATGFGPFGLGGGHGPGFGFHR